MQFLGPRWFGRGAGGEQALGRPRSTGKHAPQRTCPGGLNAQQQSSKPVPLTSLARLALDRLPVVAEAWGVPHPEPDCPRCRHHFVTYEPQWPHGCRAFDFKSKGLPRVVVEQNSGAPCQAFEATPRPAAPPSPKP